MRVHIVAHSFGGLLVRTMLQGIHLGPSEDKATHGIKMSLDIASVTTLGTPHSGLYQEDGCRGNIALPEGQDNLSFDGCGQLSCQQAGEQMVHSDKAANFYGVELTPGEIITKLYDPDVENPLPNVEVLTLIGLTTLRDDDGATVDEGDNLISYAGQRFSPSDVLDYSTVVSWCDDEDLFRRESPWPLRNDATRDNARITERVLGFPNDTEPGDVNPVAGSVGYRHSGGVPGDEPFDASCEKRVCPPPVPAEAYVACATVADCEHESLHEVLAWITSHSDSPPPPDPSTTFTIGDFVESAYDDVDVLDEPTVDGIVLGIRAFGDRGIVIAGPIWFAQYWWWKVDFDEGVDGWVIEDYLQSAETVETCDVANPIVPCTLGGITYDTFAGNYSKARIFYKASSYDTTITDGNLHLSLKSGLPHNHGYAYTANYGSTVWTSPPPYNVKFGIFGQFNGASVNLADHFEWIGAGSGSNGFVLLEDFESYPLGEFVDDAWLHELTGTATVTSEKNLDGNQSLRSADESASQESLEFEPTPDGEIATLRWFEYITDIGETTLNNPMSWTGVRTEGQGNKNYVHFCNHADGLGLYVSATPIGGGYCDETKTIGRYSYGRWHQITAEFDTLNNVFRARVGDDIWTDWKPVIGVMGGARGFVWLGLRPYIYLDRLELGFPLSSVAAQ